MKGPAISSTPPGRLHFLSCLVPCAAAVVLPAALARAVATVTITTVTTYKYNADGAPTAITTQVDGGDATTQDLTWDNFVPDASDPTTGTVSAGNGNLATAGTSLAASATYSFDHRDRLVGYSAGGQELTYTYHADGTMASSTTADGDGLLFYYNGGRLPLMTNMRQQSDGLWSAHLGPLRQISDGSEQILMKPRKDTSGEYDASSESLSAYRYEAFGACTCTGTCTCTDASGEYDIHDNPFRYAGQYRDAIWGGQYLRARWYDAQVPTFLSRDPLAQVNRYGYGDANPVMMIDPGGMKSVFDKAVDWLNSGVQGHFARVFLSPVLYPLEIVAHPGSFWNQLKRDPVQIAFIGVSALAGVGGKVVGASLVALEAQQTGIGVVQSVFSGFGDFRGSGHEHFDAMAFLESLESSIGASLPHAGVLRGVAGVGYNPFAQTVDEIEAQRASLSPGEALIFRVREPRGGHGSSFTSPLLEASRLGNYHEALVAVTSDAVYVTESYFGLATSTFADHTVGDALFEHRTASKWYPIDQRKVRFAAAGKVRGFDPERFSSNPRNLALAGESAESRATNQRARFDPIHNNCHDHVHAILRLLFPQRQ